MGGRHICWLARGGFVMAGVTFDKGYRSDLMVYISGVLPGARYALCQHMWHISAQVNTSPICHSPFSVYKMFYDGAALVQVTVQLFIRYSYILTVTYVHQLIEYMLHRPSGSDTYYVCSRTVLNRLHVGGPDNMKTKKARLILMQFRVEKPKGWVSFGYESLCYLKFTRYVIVWADMSESAVNDNAEAFHEASEHLPSGSLDD